MAPRHQAFLVPIQGDGGFYRDQDVLGYRFSVLANRAVESLHEHRLFLLLHPAQERAEDPGGDAAVGVAATLAAGKTSL